MLGGATYFGRIATRTRSFVWRDGAVCGRRTQTRPGVGPPERRACPERTAQWVPIRGVTIKRPNGIAIQPIRPRNRPSSPVPTWGSTAMDNPTICTSSVNDAGWRALTRDCKRGASGVGRAKGTSPVRWGHLMVDERDSPSAGWRETYDEMGVDDDHEPTDRDVPTRCPGCGLVVTSKEEHRCPLTEIDG